MKLRIRPNKHYQLMPSPKTETSPLLRMTKQIKKYPINSYDLLMRLKKRDLVDQLLIARQDLVELHNDKIVEFEQLKSDHQALNSRYLEAQGNLLLLMDENQKILTERLIALGKPAPTFWQKLRSLFRNLK